MNGYDKGFGSFEQWLIRRGKSPEACSCGGPDEARERGEVYSPYQHAPDCRWLISIDALWAQFHNEAGAWCEKNKRVKP